MVGTTQSTALSFPFATTSFEEKRRYQCGVCLKRFSRPTALKTHSYIHTGEKPFGCSIPGCGRRFAVVSNLRRHYRVHCKANVPVTPRVPAMERVRQVERLMERAPASPTSYRAQQMPITTSNDSVRYPNQNKQADPILTRTTIPPPQPYRIGGNHGIPEATHSESSRAAVQQCSSGNLPSRPAPYLSIASLV